MRTRFIPVHPIAAPLLSGQAITFLFALFAYRQKQVGKQDQKRIELPRKLINGPV